MKKNKTITDKNVLELLFSIDESSYENRFTQTNFVYLFGYSLDNKGRRCEVNDILEVPPNSYGPENRRNKNKFTTTVGLFIFNKIMVEHTKLFDVFDGYINMDLNKKNVGKVEKKISRALTEDKIDTDTAKEFYNKIQWITSFVNVICEQDDEQINVYLNKISKEKKRLLTKYKKEIDAMDEATIIMVEKELLEFGKELIKGGPLCDLYDSGMCSYGNHFKDVFIMRGLVSDPRTGKFHFIPKSYAEGLDKESYFITVRTQATGAYSRGQLTAIGGAMEKEFNRAFQHMKIINGDCGTNKTITIKLTDKNVDKYLYSNIVIGQKIVNLNEESIPKYIDKDIKIRFPTTCKRIKGHVCSTCCGTLFESLEIENIGLAINVIGSTLKRLQMKSFHDSQVSIKKINLEEAFGKL